MVETNAPVAIPGPGEQTPGSVRTAALQMDALLDAAKNGVPPQAPAPAAPGDVVPARDIRNTETERANEQIAHNWDKRREDAANAQRALSTERNKLNQTVQELDAKNAQAAQLLEQLSPLLEMAKAISPVDPNANLPLAIEKPEATLNQWKEDGAGELADTLGQLYDAVRALTSRVAKLETDLQNQARAVVDTVGGIRGTSVFAQLDASFPGWQECVADPAFDKWLNALPRSIKAAYSDVLDRTIEYDFEDAAAVLRAFAGSTGYVFGEKPTPQNPSATQLLDRIPIPAGGSASAAKASDPMQPMTEAELHNFSFDFSKASPEQRKILRQRYDLTLEARINR